MKTRLTLNLKPILCKEKRISREKLSVNFLALGRCLLNTKVFVTDQDHLENVDLLKGYRNLQGKIGDSHAFFRDNQIDRWIDGQIDRQIDRQMDRWIDEQMDRWVDGQMDRWMDGWMDGTLYFNTAFYQIKIYSNIKIWFT